MPVTSRRTLVAYKLTCHEARKPDKLFELDSLYKGGFTRAFVDFCGSDQSAIQQKGLGKYCHLEKPKVQDEGVLLELQSGSNGDNISILDPGLDSIVCEYDSEKAPMVRSRVYLRNPVGNYSILCVEHVKGSAGDTFLKTPFKNWLKAAAPGCLLDWEPVAEEESLDAFKSIEDFEVRKYLRSSDMADSLITGANYISYKLAHKRRQPFPIALLKEALSDFTKAKTIFGLVESDITDNKVDVFVRANSKDGRTVKFDISSSFDMKIRELLNDRGEAVLSDSAFVKRCNDKCEIIEHRLGRA